MKVADFGLSRAVGTETEYYRLQTKSRALPLRWTAPEVLQTAKWSKHSDVWSFGMLLYELYTHGEMPLGGLENEEIIAALRGYGPDSRPLVTLPASCPRLVSQLQAACLSRFVKRGSL